MKLIPAVIIAVSVTLVTTPAVAGDVAAGETAYNSKGCVSCHGTAGNSQIPANPTLTGKDAAYVKKQLTDFKSGAREGTVMNIMAKTLSDEDIDNVAAYLSEQQ